MASLLTDARTEAGGVVPLVGDEAIMFWWCLCWSVWSRLLSWSVVILEGIGARRAFWIACCLLLGGVAPENLRGRGLPLSTFLRVPELAMRMAFAATGELRASAQRKSQNRDQRQRDLPSETRGRID